MSQASKAIASSAAKLGLAVVIAVALLSGAFLLTREQILEQQRRAELRSLQEIVPQNLYNNDLIDDVIQAQGLGGSAPRKIYRARQDGAPVAVIMRVTAINGYNGDIELLVGILADGSIAGVRVTSHKETPGLGDRIDTRVGDWIYAFSGRSLSNPDAERWGVRRDGGEFDQFTGATITPRAVVAEVRRALEYFQEHREELFR